MKILTLGTDSTLLDPKSASSRRLSGYSSIFKYQTIIVPSKIKTTMHIAGNITVVGSGGRNKFCQIFRIVFLSVLKARSGKYDVVSSQDPFEFGFAAWLAARLSGSGLEIQMHGDFFSVVTGNLSLLNRIRRYTSFFVLRRADSIRVVSRRMKTDLIKRFDVLSERITVVPVFTEPPAEINGVRPPSVLRGLTPFISAGNFLFLAMTRLTEEKNLPMMIRAFGCVAGKIPEARLLIVGRGPLREKLVQLVGELNLTGRVIFVDWTENIYDYYYAADAYVLSSNFEGWGRVIVEAAWCKLPIVMTDVGCAGELIVNGEGGLVVPVGDEIALSHAMEKIARDGELRKKLGERAYLAATKLPNREETLRLYKKSWEKALM